MRSVTAASSLVTSSGASSDMTISGRPLRRHRRRLGASDDPFDDEVLVRDQRRALEPVEVDSRICSERSAGSAA